MSHGDWWRAFAATVFAWLPTPIAVAGAAAHWNVILLLGLVAGSWVLIYTLTRVLLEGVPKSGGDPE